MSSLPPSPVPAHRDPRELLEETFVQVLRAIILCKANGLYAAALVLLFSAIDTAAWISAAADDPQPRVRERFTAWIERYMIPKLPSPACSALELYAARCGLVHTLSAASDLSAKGTRRIVYAWKPSLREDLHKLSSLGDLPRDYIAVQGEDLIAAFARGLESSLNELSLDPARIQLALSRANGFFSHLSSRQAASLMDWARELLGPDW